MKVPTRPLTALAVGLLIALPLAGCGKDSDEDATSTSGTATEAATSDGGGSATPDASQLAAETPQERVTGYIQASDKAASSGWKDLSYLDDYLTPELADTVRQSEQKNADTGASIQGTSRLTDFRLLDQTDTEATLEFCEDLTGLAAEKDGQPTPIANAATAPSVARYTLVRDDATQPWKISEKGYYDASTTCEQHFGG